MRPYCDPFLCGVGRLPSEECKECESSKRSGLGYRPGTELPEISAGCRWFMVHLRTAGADCIGDDSIPAGTLRREPQEPARFSQKRLGLYSRQPAAGWR